MRVYALLVFVLVGSSLCDEYYEELVVVETTTAAGKTTAPAGKATAPVGKATAPAGKITAQAGKATAPAGKATEPAGKTTAPAGKATAPADDCHDLNPMCEKLTVANCTDKYFGGDIQKNCPKLCDTCHVTTLLPTTETPCIDGTLIDCEANVKLCGVAEIMNTLCVKTCGLCGTTAGPTTESSCQDDPTADCTAKKSLCTNPDYKGILNAFCPVTCGFCGPNAPCEDSDSRCTEWKLQGFCTNPNYTPQEKAVCKKTCGLC